MRLSSKRMKDKLFSFSMGLCDESIDSFDDVFVFFGGDLCRCGGLPKRYGWKLHKE